MFTLVAQRTRRRVCRTFLARDACAILHPRANALEASVIGGDKLNLASLADRQQYRTFFHGASLEETHAIISEACIGGSRTFASKADRDRKSRPEPRGPSQPSVSKAKAPEKRNSTSVNNSQRKSETKRVDNSQNISSIKDVRQRLAKLEELASYLKPSSFSLTDITTTPSDRVEERNVLFEGTQSIVERLEAAVDGCKIQPSGKHGRDVSSILGRILAVYSISCHENLNQSVFDENLRVLALLDSWNLDCLEPHYHYSIVAAVKEKRWTEAARLYQQQFDRDTSGFCPVGVSSSSPLGIYSIARAAQETGSGVVESVMDAVTELSLLSPTDQVQHALAAGTAIGMAGEWEAFVSYLKTSSNASTLGQPPVVAAVMHACLLRHSPQASDAATEVFQSFSDKNHAISSEFHWGGGHDQTSFPLLRDLAMRCHVLGCEQSESTRALELLHEAIDEEFAVSEDALYGVLCACERDMNWRGAVGVLLQLLDGNKTLYIVPSTLEIPSVDDEKALGRNHVSFIEKGRVLSCVMRACNTAEQFGLSLLCHTLVNASNLLPPQARAGPSVNSKSVEIAMLAMLREVDNSEELLSALIVALCGVESFDQAKTLFTLVKECPDDFDSASQGFLEAEQAFQFAEGSADSSPNQRQWQIAQRHMDRISRALHAIRLEGESLDQSQLRILSSALASVLRSCTKAGHPEPGIILFEYAQTELSRFAPVSTGSRFTLGRESENEELLYGLTCTDSFLSEKMKALQAVDQKESVLSLLESSVGTFEAAPEKWTQSSNKAMEILAENGELEAAAVLFQTHLKSTLGNNVETYLVAAQIFAGAGRWSDVGDVYHTAMEKGCLSTELGVLAMKAVVQMNLPGKMRVLRGIVGDTAKAVGTDPAHWLESRYWKLKKVLGFSQASLLMWWNNPNERLLDELQFALEVFHKRLDEGLQAKSPVLRLIVSRCRYFNGEIPDGAGANSRMLIPREKSDWAELLLRVLDQSGNLRNDESFIDEAAMALRHLDCNVECVNYVGEALKRGVHVRQAAINEALAAAEAAGIEDEEDASDMRKLIH